MEKKEEVGRGCVEGKAIGERQEGFRADEGFSRPPLQGVAQLPWEIMCIVSLGL